MRNGKKHSISLGPISTTVRVALLAISMTLVASLGAAQYELDVDRLISGNNIDEYRPQVAFNSHHDEYLVVWHDNSPIQRRAILGKRLDLFGNTLEQFTIFFEATRDNAQPTVAYDSVNDRYLVAWVRDIYGDGSDWGVMGLLVPWDGPGPVIFPFLINNFATNQWNPRVDFSPEQQQYLVTWWNEGAGGVASYVSARKVNSNGTSPGGSFVVASGSTEMIAPDVAYNPLSQEFLVVYQNMQPGGGDIYGARVGPLGIVGSGPFAIAAWPDSEVAPRVAASATTGEWAVVWQSDVAGLMQEIYARRFWVDAAGIHQFAAPARIIGTPVDEKNPAIAALPLSRKFLVAWEHQYSNASGPLGIQARTLDDENGLGTRMPVSDQFVAGYVDSTLPEIAAGPRGWFVVWEQERLATPSYQDIRGRAVHARLFVDDFERGSLTGWTTSSP